MNIDCALTDPQLDFVLADEKFPAFCGGFGAGKSEALVTRLLLRKLKYPECDVGYFAPTFDLIRLIAWPRFEAKLDEWGIAYKLHKSDNMLRLATGGAVIFRTLDAPDRIVGFEIGDAGIDELDTLKEEHAQNAWNKVIARCRQKKRDGAPNTAAVATTPEGFRLVYKLWQRDPKPGYRLYRAPTYSNPFLPVEYVEQLRNTYPSQLLAAYLEGEFVNLTSGAVYPEFSRALNHTDATIEHGEPLHVGVDFNVYNCTAIVGVIRDNRPLILAELTGLRDTPAMAKLLVERYKSQGHHVTVYPDASGQGHKSVNAALSDLQILKEAGLSICANSVNPAVRDRVAAVNSAILNAKGERKLLVNTRACPSVTECLEQQVYDKNGEPDKSAGKDHAPDALGYFVHYRWPIVKPVAAHGANIIHMAR